MAKIKDDETNYYAPTHDLGEWDFPLWSEVLPNLWLGGTDDFDTIDHVADTYAERNITPKDFDAVVTLYAWARPVDWMVAEMRYGFYDSDTKHIDEARLYDAVNFAHQMWKAGKKVLIRCQAGINRSGLTMGLVLMKEGYPAEEAIALMRDKRSKFVLLNHDFVKFLMDKEKVKNEK